MSELSLISNQYKKVDNTTDKVNKSIITLKKRNLPIDIPEASKKKIIFSEDDVISAKNYIVDFLEFLLKLQKENISESEYIPHAFITEFQSKVINNTPYFEDEIKKIIESIKENGKLEKLQFNVLDKMASVLDNQRTVLFKKLRSARG